MPLLHIQPNVAVGCQPQQPALYGKEPQQASSRYVFPRAQQPPEARRFAVHHLGIAWQRHAQLLHFVWGRRVPTGVSFTQSVHPGSGMRSSCRE